LPLEVTRRLEIEQLGVLGFALLTAANGAGAVETLTRLFPIVTDSGAWSTQRRNGAFVVNWHRAPSRCTGEHLSTEATLAHFVACSRQVFVGADAPRLRRVSLAHPVARQRLALLRQYFDCPLELDAGRDGLEWDADLMDARPRLSNRAMHEHFLAIAAPLVHAVKRPAPYAEQVRAQLRGRLAVGEPSMTEVARALGLATRTLRRRLAEERATFQQLLDEVRMQLAGELFTRAGASVTQVAFDLGFSDSTAFARAHKRWHGQAPTVSRRARRLGGV
jgi:AraC-like DNA-binding protein